MGDGNYDRGRNRVRIFTNSFSHEDCVRLAAAITTAPSSRPFPHIFVENMGEGATPGKKK